MIYILTIFTILYMTLTIAVLLVCMLIIYDFTTTSYSAIIGSMLAHVILTYILLSNEVQLL